MDCIQLTNMAFWGYHGCLEEEQRNGQPFYVDLKLYCSLRTAGKTDDLAATIDYSKVYALLRQIMTNTSYHLIEALAETVSEKILFVFPVEKVCVTVHKPQAPMGGLVGDVAVTIERGRHE